MVVQKIDFNELDKTLYRSRSEEHKFDLIYKDFDYKKYSLNCEPGGGFIEEFWVKLFEETQPQLIIELGAWLGFSCVYMANLCQKYHKSNYRIFSIDTWLGNWHYPMAKWKNGYPTMYYQFIANLHYNKVEKNVYPIPLPTNTAIRNIEERKE